MQNLNKLKWNASLAFECFGVKVGVRANQGLTIEEIRSILPLNSKEIEAAEVDRLFSVQIGEKESVFYHEEKEKFRVPGNDWVKETLKSQLTYCVSTHTAERVFIHAGAVAWNNCLILLPGNGCAGKTTLTAELVKAGAVYYSDDYAILDENGLVYPYPKPLSIREKGSMQAAQTDVDVSHFGGVQATEPLPVGLVVITEYKARARWRPRVLSAGQGVIEILKYTNNSLKRPEIVLPVLRKVALQAKIIKSKRGEAQKTAREILQECSAKL